MSYKRRTADRQRALRARYETTGAGATPRTYHKTDERRGGPMASKRDYRRKPKHEEW